jgi:hypothetical protein
LITKLDKLRAAAAAGDWERVVAIAAAFPSLGAEKDRIMKAREAFVRPEFQRQLGRDPEKLKTDGIAAIREKYRV